jgi:hypothetical protein
VKKSKSQEVKESKGQRVKKLSGEEVKKELGKGKAAAVASVRPASRDYYQ